MKTFRHILVPTDFSDTAREALHAAVDLVRGTQTRLTVVHVIRDIWNQAWTVEAGVDLAAMDRELREHARSQLQSLLTEERLDTAGVSTDVLVGPPHLAIIDYAQGQHVDLIVMGSHGHGPVHRFLLGSVAERLVRAGTCPVLTVPHHTLRASDNATHPQETVAATAVGGAAPRGIDHQC
jgi:nucleotide-binding universal stress UspA family protein